MPDMSGAEVLSAIRQEEILKDTPVLMLTSIDNSQTNRELNQLGADALLTKPTRSSMLLETILQIIANNRECEKTIIDDTIEEEPIVEITKQEQPEKTTYVNANPDIVDILVAEDNEVNQIVFRQILEDTGLNFKIVENGRLALSAYKACKPKLILMDVSMPEMNGKEATVAIRQFEREKEITRTPIVGITAHALKGDMEACIDAGMDDYLSKPVSPKKLTIKVEQWLKLNLQTQANL